MNNFFSYGTIQQENVQLQLYGRSIPGSKDYLPGFRIIFVENKDPQSLSRGEEQVHKLAVASGNASDHIEGTVFELTDEEINLTDRYQPDGYTRIRVRLQSGKEAWTYASI